MDSPASEPKRKRFSKEKILITLIILSIILNLYFIYNFYCDNSDYQRYIKNHFGSQEQELDLLSPQIAWLDTKTFIDQQKSFTISYLEIKPKIIEMVTKNVSGHYGVYVEDLTTGAWLGVNEKEEFTPASMYKVPIMVAILKQVEKGNLKLDDKIKLRQEDINLDSGSLGLKGAGYNATIKELLSEMIQDSDNTAFFTLANRVITYDQHVEALLAVGLPEPNKSNSVAMITPKETGNMFRALYFSSFLRRTFSQLALSILSETAYDSNLRAQIPNEIKISHKVGFFESQKLHNDCGIVYLTKKPYIICIMSKNSSKEEASRIIKEVSQTIYEFTTKKQ
jgi:beta-lactamase class A